MSRVSIAEVETVFLLGSGLIMEHSTIVEPLLLSCVYKSTIYQVSAIGLSDFREVDRATI